MRRHAKASSAGLTDGSGKSRRLLAVLVLAICAFAISAAPAGAEAPKTEIEPVSNVSYASAHVSGLVFGEAFATGYTFQYSTDDNEWVSGPGGFFFGARANPVQGDITGLKGETKYFVRLVATSGEEPMGTSPGPDPQFTTLPVDPPSVVSIDNATEVKYSSAKVAGKVSRPSNEDTAFDVECRFQYVTDAQFNANGFKEPGSTPCEPDAIHSAGSSDVKANLSGLANNTTYHLRLFVANASPNTDAKEAPSTFTTQAIAKPSVLSIDSAAEVEYTTAAVSGEAEAPSGDDPGFNPECAFEYVTDAQFNATGFEGASQAGCEPALVPGAGPTKVAATLTGLSAATKYHLRLSAKNAGGTDSKEAVTFTTEGPIPTPSVLTVDNAAEVEYTQAKVSGQVERPSGVDHALDSECAFEYVTDAQFGVTGFEGASQAGCEPALIGASGPTDVKAKLTGLSPATKYHLRLSAHNTGGSNSKDAAATFTTLGPVPTPSVLSIDNAAEVTYTTAEVSGEAESPPGDDPGLSPECAFEYISDADFANHNEVQALFISSGAGTFKLGFKGQETASLAFNAKAAAVGSALEGLATIGAGNVSVSGGPGNKQGSFPYLITFGGALGNVNVPALDADESALTDRQGSFGLYMTMPTQGHAEGFEDASQAACEPALVPGAGPTDVSANLTGLSPATKYHLRLSAKNAGGSDSKEAATFTTLAATPPSASVDPVTTFTSTTAQFTGKVNPNGTDPAFNTEWYFQCSPACGVSIGGIAQRIDADETDHVVAESTSNLEPNTTYQVKLIAKNGGGQSESTPQSFKTASEPPSVQTSYSSEVDAHSITVAGRVNSHNSPATYQFEWGLDKAYGSSVPVSPAPLGSSDNVFHTVSEAIAGLQEGTLYHFRLAATNTDTGITTHGEDHTFTTSPAVTCPNEQLRAENGSLSLPNCRAYEMVSPIEKSGNDAGFPVQDGFGIETTGYSLAAADGDSVLYFTKGSVGNAHDGISQATLSHRQANDWTTGSALPRGDQKKINLFRTAIGIFASSDLKRMVWESPSSWVADNPFSSTFSSAGLYRGYVDESSPVEWITRPRIPDPQPPLGQAFNYAPWLLGGSPDLDTLYIWYNQTLLPGDLANTWELYEYANGKLEPAGTLPDGEMPSGGSAPANLHPPRDRGTETNPETPRNSVSRDGSTFFFISPDPGTASGVPLVQTELYVRRDGHSTLVSHGEDGKPAPSGAEPVSSGVQSATVVPGQYVFASPDGNMAIFQSRDALTSDAPHDDSLKAYRYDVKTNAVSYLPGLGGATVVASSDDGSRFLFGQGRIAVWDHGTITTVANGGGSTGLAGAGLYAILAPARATASGSTFVFSTTGVPGFNAGMFSQTYRYDLEQDQLTCISCPPDGVVPSGSAGLGPYDDGLSPNPIITSPDADRVFFDSPDPLAPEDVNGTRDIYEWTPSGVSLISSGHSTKPSFFVANSASGGDAFFSTAQGIDPDDQDGLYDVYDARVGGGFPRPVKATPCSGEECRAAASTPPAAVTAASKSFAGAGNQAPRKPKSHKKKKHHKKRAHKRAAHKRGGSK